MISDAKLTNPEKADHFMKQYVALLTSYPICRRETDGDPCVDLCYIGREH